MTISVIRMNFILFGSKLALAVKPYWICLQRLRTITHRHFGDDRLIYASSRRLVFSDILLSSPARKIIRPIEAIKPEPIITILQGLCLILSYRASPSQQLPPTDCNLIVISFLLLSSSIFSINIIA